ncbi:KilA-N domain-containing protein [Salmonella enterica]|nr:KilA-N domain-containing protein [Salmonella enterica]EAW6597721.1 KilA-N domain-containing protein [Salmonella enterica]EAY3794102.1 KilA-N domain-containing protein [Salmonella enterica]EBA8948664.1 KilA-N domain-containing protein [Salmonella enterica]EBB2277145.1 KilA-N domain-containing protein [Salmonella enterica]
MKKIKMGIPVLLNKAVNSVHGGTTLGTFAHELLSIEYAGWISPPTYSGVRGFISWLPSQ